jgi:hypothetical protein
LISKGLQFKKSPYEPGGREFDEAREARRRTSPRSGDGAEQREGFAAAGREQSLRARQFQQWLTQRVSLLFF